jgi:molecular chaperone GrpE
MTDNRGDKTNLQVHDRSDDQQKKEPESEQTNEVKAATVCGNSHPSEITTAESVSEDKGHDLAEALQLAEDNRDKWMRAVAEFENYKKRTIQERSKLLKYKNEELLRDILPVIDNLERAISASSHDGSDALLQGVKMTVGMFRDVLGRYGVTPIESLGKIFNPEFQEAIAALNDPDKQPNSIIDELERGYMYQDKLLRPAKVVVSTR